jgi:predicted XRE-type DNA-binding protein
MSTKIKIEQIIQTKVLEILIVKKISRNDYLNLNINKFTLKKTIALTFLKTHSPTKIVKVMSRKINPPLPKKNISNFFCGNI